jgi:hypothetical protein
MNSPWESGIGSPLPSLLAINIVAQKEDATLKSCEDDATLKSCEDVAGARRTQPPVDCLWSLEPSFPGLSVNL